MKKFMIGEMSAVDVPAVEGATALILKRHDATEKNLDEEDRGIVLLTSAVDGHTHAVFVHPGMRGGETSFGSDPDKDSSHDHPWILDGTGRITIGENDGHDHTVDPQQIFEMIMNKDASVQKPVLVSNTDLWDDYAIKFEHPDQEDHMPAPELTKEEKAVKSAEERATSAEATAARATQVAELTDAQKAHFNDLDEDGQTAYLGKTATERQDVIDKAVAKAADEDPVVYTDGSGREYRKSDDARLTAMAKERDEDRKELVKSRVATEQAGFEKRAESELPDLPGDLPVRAAIVKAIDGIEDEDTRKAAHESVQAGNKAIKAAFSTVGARAANESVGAESELDELAKAYAKEHTTDFHTAYGVVAANNPELAKRAINGE
jgi:hypothetical protein